MVEKVWQHDNIILFPGMVDKLIERAHHAVELSRYSEANELFEQVLNYRAGDEYMLSVYAHSLYEVKNYERAKEICEDLIALQPEFYFEVMELYLTICMQLKQFQQVEKIIQTLFDDQMIPIEQQEKFQRIQQLNKKIAMNKQQVEQEELDDSLEIAQMDAEQFLELTIMEQLIQVQQFSEVNIRPYKEFFKQMIETNKLHPFIQSLLLSLLVEQEVSIEIIVAKFGMERKVNPSELDLPTELPQYQEIYSLLANRYDQNPTVWEMLQNVLSKHAIVAYPFEWTPHCPEDVAKTYEHYVNAMFGKNEEHNCDIMNKIQLLDQLSELQ